MVSMASLGVAQVIRSIWLNCYPPRVQLTMWMACLEKLKTGDLLHAKGIIDAQQALCPLCNLQVESNVHILFSCQFSWQTWMKMLEWWGLSGVIQDRCESFIVAWFGLMNVHKWKILWNLILGCVIWSLWYMRNKSKFESLQPDFHCFIYNLKIKIGVWAKELLSGMNATPLDFCHNLGAVVS